MRNKGHFKQGHTPWNRGKKGYMGANATSFKKGELPPTAHPEGTIVRTERHRSGRVEVYYTINIDWRGDRRSKNNYKWYLWEVENQRDRPAGMVITTKNGNPDDIRIDNLEVITRSENLRRNSWN